MHSESLTAWIGSTRTVRRTLYKTPDYEAEMEIQWSLISRRWLALGQAQTETASFFS